MGFKVFGRIILTGGCARHTLVHFTMARVYVGTYGKYNNGSLKGGWLNLADYPKYEDFLKACKALHKGEHDPEFMIQDTEDFPDGLSCMEWLSEQDFYDVKLAMKEEEQTEQGKPSINIIDYSEKAFAVVGDTKAVKDDLKKLGGRFNSKLSCGCGWIFSNKMREEVERFISSGEVVDRVRAERKTPADGAQFVEWLKEYISKYRESYSTQHSVGAIKLHDGYYLINKPSIDNRFCFHDEGENYEYYKHLMEDRETRLAKHFKTENLSEFDNKIDRITKGGDYGTDKRVWYKVLENGETELCFYSSWGVPDNYTECSEDDKKLILKGLKFGRAMFEKRLDAYLKRYGTSKIHTWTYWADA